MKELCIDGLVIRMERRKIKNLNIYVKPPFGEVFVTVPMRMKEERVLEFIRSREEWIRKARERVRQRSEAMGAQERTFTQEEKNALLEQVLRCAEKWEPRLGVHSSKWQIREMKTRWGSCSVHSGQIRINLRLADKPEECLEYVVVHELCHLLEPSHNQRFHSLMTQFLPDWKERKKRLENKTE